MKKTVLEIYALLVCFVAIVCFSIWLGIGAYSVVGIFSPETTMSAWTYQRHQSNQQFIVAPPMLDSPFSTKDKVEKLESLAESVVTKNRLDSYALELKAEARSNTQSVLRAAIVIVISMFLFFMHWRILKSKS